jgi:hypothetical protein
MAAQVMPPTATGKYTKLTEVKALPVVRCGASQLLAHRDRPTLAGPARAGGGRSAQSGLLDQRKSFGLELAHAIDVARPSQHDAVEAGAL